MSKRTAFILGATGLVGSELLRVILDDPEYTGVVAPTRRPLGTGHAKLREIDFDFNDWEILSAQLPVDDVFCCLGTTRKQAGSKEAFRRVDFDYPLELARRASRAGCKRYFLVSSIGSDPKSPIYYSRVKGEIEQAVQAEPFAAVHIMRPSLLLGERGGPKRIGEELGMALSGAIGWTLVGPMRKYRAIQATTVARAMRALAIQGESGIFIHESDAIERIGAESPAS